MAYIEIKCSNYTYENNKIYINLLNENITNLSDFTNTDELYVYIQYTYKLTNGETVYDVFEKSIEFLSIRAGVPVLNLLMSIPCEINESER